MLRSSLALALLAACSTPPPASPAVARPSGTALPTWTALQQRLPGRWIATVDGQRIPVTFQRISNDTAILETFGPPGRQTALVYHRDGTCLVATHYCAQGNQPRLRTCAGDPAHPVLRMTDVTDRDPDEAVLVELAFDLSGPDAFERIEDYVQADGSHERTTFHYTRAHDAASN